MATRWIGTKNVLKTAAWGNHHDTFRLLQVQHALAYAKECCAQLCLANEFDCVNSVGKVCLGQKTSSDRGMRIDVVYRGHLNLPPNLLFHFLEIEKF